MIRTMIAALVLTTSAQAEEIQWKNLNKNFRIGVTSNACFVSTMYNSKTELTFRAFSEWSGFDFMVCNSKWKMSKGKEYPARAQVDDGGWDISLIAGKYCFHTKKNFSWDSDFYSDMGGKKDWQLYINGKPIHRKTMLLNGSKEALWALKQCRGKLSSETFGAPPSNNEETF